MSASARARRRGELRRVLDPAAARRTGEPEPPPAHVDAPAITGTLYVVATPIGNLEDITLRALRVLAEVDVVAAEDTRRTGNLLRHYEIRTPLVSLHQHNERHRTDTLLARLRSGQSVALVTDAGTPGIADPGALFVRAAREAGIPVTPLPGPNAAAAALSASGIVSDRFAFAGFPPTRSNDRKKWFDWVARLADVPVVIYEAPHRAASTLRELRESLADRPIIVARELTKLHEEWRFLPSSLPGAVEVGATPLSNPAEAGEDREERGEFVIILGALESPPQPDAVPSDDEIAAVFGQLTKEDEAATRRDAVRAVATQLNLSPKAVYDALERAKRQSQT
jgi:16S rRNA (cytidine1402-2'-O)-methyltransferase